MGKKTKASLSQFSEMAPNLRGGGGRAKMTVNSKNRPTHFASKRLTFPSDPVPSFCKQKWILSFLSSNTLTFALSFRQLLLIISSIHHHHHFITRLPPSSIGSAHPHVHLPNWPRL
ncbi:hypothetical protein GPALN_003664 [Globodera pallida]|nr:hypothetical protein GPALN_003664 [Globodera pallida]